MSDYINVLNYARGAKVRFACVYNKVSDTINHAYSLNSYYYDESDWDWDTNTDWRPQSSLSRDNLENTLPSHNGLTGGNGNDIYLVAGICPYSPDTPLLSTVDKLEVSWLYSDGNCEYVDFYTSNSITVEEANKNKDFIYWDTIHVPNGQTPTQKVVPERTFRLLYASIYGSTKGYIEIGYIKAFGIQRESFYQSLVQEGTDFKYLEGDTWKSL